MGRPRKYTKKTLSEAVELYFASITRKVTPTESVDTGKRDDKGHKIYEQRPIENSLGEIAEIDRRVEALSELERCCFGYGVGRAGPEGPDGRQQARVEACAARLAELIPRLDRLDF